MQSAALTPPPASAVEGTRLTIVPGLLGFEEYHNYVVVEEPDSPVVWLCSVEEPLLTFPAIEPFLICPDYSFELSDAEVEALRLRTPTDTAVLVVITLRSEPPGATANLMAPVVMNRSERLGRQIVLSEGGYPLRYPIAGAAQQPPPRRPNARKRR